jgi:hypothetical protein
MDRLVPVRVVRHGTNKPARVLVRFEDPAMEGKEDWVPPPRLKVLWHAAEAFEAREATWDALCALSPDDDVVETWAANDVFDTTLGDEEIASFHWKHFYLEISDLPALAAKSGLATEEFTGDPVGFEDDGTLVVSWPVALRAAQALALRHPDSLLALVDREEREFQRRAIHGYYSSGNRPVWFEPEWVREHDGEIYDRPRRELLRVWCGAAATARWDELEELRKEIKRVGDVAERAIEALRTGGQTSVADRLARELGETVEMLRADPSDR